MFLGLYVFLLFKRMFLKESDSNFVRINVIDLDTFGSQDLNNTEMTVFHVLKKQLGKTPYIDDEFETYLHLNFVQQNNNYKDRGPKYGTKKHIDTKTIRGRNCKAEDFSGSPERNQ